MLSALLLGACGDSASPAPAPEDTPDAGQPAAHDAASADASQSESEPDAGVVLGPDVEVGAFGIELVPPDPEAGKAGFTQLSGRVYDGPAVARIIWELSAEQDGCQLLTPRVPFCEESCGSEVCVEDDTCAPEPGFVDVGLLTVTGLHGEDGAPVEITATGIQGSYSTPPGLLLDYPSFAEGDTLRVAGGGTIPAFAIEAVGIAPLELSASASYVLAADAPLELRWTPKGASGASRIAVELDVSHHGGTKGKIVCDVEDDGAHAIAAPLVEQLVALGVAGFPAVSVTRISEGTTRTSVGRVALRVRSTARHEVAIPNLISCSDDVPCPDGKVCRDDLTCG